MSSAPSNWGPNRPSVSQERPSAPQVREDAEEPTPNEGPKVNRKAAAVEGVETTSPTGEQLVESISPPRLPHSTRERWATTPTAATGPVRPRARKKPERSKNLPVARKPIEPTLHRIYRKDAERNHALASNDLARANLLLGEVAQDLDGILDHIYATLEAPGHSVQNKIKNKLPALLARNIYALLPFDELGDALNLSPQSISAVKSELAAHGRPDLRHIDAAKAAIEDLRAELAQAQIAKDHSLLERIVAFVEKLATTMMIAAAAAPIAALAVADDVAKEVIKAAVTALIAVALSDFVKAAKQQMRFRDPYVRARTAHDRLLAELSSLVTCQSTICDTSRLEIAARKTRTLTSIYLCQMAQIDFQPHGNSEYWRNLVDLAAHLSPLGGPSVNQQDSLRVIEQSIRNNPPTRPRRE